MILERLKLILEKASKVLISRKYSQRYNAIAS